MHAILDGAHTSKRAIYQISRHLMLSFSSSGNMGGKKSLKYLPTQASIGSDVSLQCGATLAPAIGYYFLGGSLQFSSLIESSRLMTTRRF